MRPSDLILYGFLVAVAISCAAHVSKEQRGAALIAASIFAANWVFYILAWSGTLLGMDISPASLINDFTYSGAVSHQATWAFADALAAVLIVLIAHKFWWAYALWGIYTLQVYQHYTVSVGSDDFGLYLYGLDLLFVAIVAVFILIGGKGTWEHVSRIAGDLYVRGLCGLRGALGKSRYLGGG